MDGAAPTYDVMTLWEWALAGARLHSEVEELLELACKPLKKERLRRFGETRLDSTERAMAELRQSLAPAVIAGLAVEMRERLAPQFAEAARFDVQADLEHAIDQALEYMVKDCLRAARARIRRAAKAAERAELRKQIPAFLAAYEILLEAEGERIRNSGVDVYDSDAFMQLMEESRARMAEAEAEVERLGVELEVLEMRVRRMEEIGRRATERRAEATRAVRKRVMSYAPSRSRRPRS